MEIPDDEYMALIEHMDELEALAIDKIEAMDDPEPDVQVRWNLPPDREMVPADPRAKAKFALRHLTDALRAIDSDINAVPPHVSVYDVVRQHVISIEKVLEHLDMRQRTQSMDAMLKDLFDKGVPDSPELRHTIQEIVNSTGDMLKNVTGQPWHIDINERTARIHIDNDGNVTRLW